MTIFSVNPYDRRMERLMMTVPKFAPRGVGFRFTEAQVFITTTAATPTEILTATMRQIDKARLGEYIGRLDGKTLAAVDRAIVVSLGIKYLEELLNG